MSTHLDSWDYERIHRAKVVKKLQKIQGLQALLEAWEGHSNVDHAYLLELRRKLHSAQNQYDAMKP